MSSPPEAVTSNDASDLFSTVGRVAYILGSDHFPPADRASLRRFAPGQAPSLAYYRFWARWMQRDAPPEAQTQPWAAVLFGIALMGARGHTPRCRLGSVLAEHGYSEFRLERLLAAEEPTTRLQIFARMVRFLAAKGAAIDWADTTAWLLAGPARQEKHNHQIARDYYGAAYRNAKPSITKE